MAANSVEFRKASDADVSIRAAASRTFWTAGNSRPIRIAMIAITTKSSISVNAERRVGRTRRHMIHLRWRRETREQGELEPPVSCDYCARSDEKSRCRWNGNHDLFARRFFTILVNDGGDPIPTGLHN